MPVATRQRPSRDADRYVFVPLPTCPRCDSADLAHLGTRPPEPDGSRSRYRQCKGCGHRFILVTERAERE